MSILKCHCCHSNCWNTLSINSMWCPESYSINIFIPIFSKISMHGTFSGWRATLIGLFLFQSSGWYTVFLIRKIVCFSKSRGWCYTSLNMKSNSMFYTSSELYILLWVSQTNNFAAHTCNGDCQSPFKLQYRMYIQ